MEEALLQTEKYSLFELHPFNRNVEKTKAIESSMERYGWIGAFPMYVIKNGKRKLLIKDGHHRFVAAKNLGIPVKYVLCKGDGPTILELQKSLQVWNMKDYLEANVNEGRPEYLAVKAFQDKTGIGLSNCISLLAGESAGSHNKSAAFKGGGFKLGEAAHASQVAQVVTHLKNIGIPWASSRLFVEAISKVLRLEEFDLVQFNNKASVNPGLFEKQPNVRAYLKLIEDVYNCRSRNKIPIAFLTEQKGKERQAAFGKA